MRAFTMYRRADLSATHDSNQANPPDEPQFEGVLFSDGKVAVRWLTATRSTSVWDSFTDLMAIHGHPEYDSELVWWELGKAGLQAFAEGIALEQGLDPATHVHKLSWPSPQNEHSTSP